MSIPFSLRAELKGVEVAPGVTLRYWEAGAGRALVMLPGLGHACQSVCACGTASDSPYRLIDWSTS